MPLSDLPVEISGFRSTESVREQLVAACRANPDVAEFHPVGLSEEGRPIDAVILGNGPKSVSLIAGSHSDEPVGPETLRTLILEGLRHRERLQPLWKKFRLIIFPHINPDGEARNQAWMRRWPDVGAYLQHVFREPPGRDVEFGYPDLRVENRTVAGFLQKHAPFALHMSLHGMAFSEGALLLIERHWIDRTQELRRAFREYARRLGLPLHDHDRKGEKGFRYIEPGFTTTPEGRAMQAHFRALGDRETAAKFRLSSMEYVRRLGGDPLCLVTELPLFVLRKRIAPPQPGVPTTYLEFKKRIPELIARINSGAPIAPIIEAFGVEPLPLKTAIRFQLFTLSQALELVVG